MLQDQRKTARRMKTGMWIRRLLLAWLTAAAAEYLLLPEQLRKLAGTDGLAQMSLLRVLLLTIILTGAVWLLSCFWKTEGWERWGLVSVFSVLALACLWSSASWAFLSACLLCFLILVIYAFTGWNTGPETVTAGKGTHKVYYWITAVVSVLFFLYVSFWTVARVYSFSTPTYDFGIFSQMFYYMKETGAPLTTVERDELLSHFAVHVSPVYYLMLPFYWLIPTPATLQVLQAAVITSAVIPLWMIGKHRGLTDAQRTLVCTALLLYPAFCGGTSYDIHENCFLTPLLLWLFYGIDKRNLCITAIAAVLTLMVKEDAAVYVAVISLWLIMRTLLRLRKPDIRNLITGIGLLIASVCWFFLVTDYLEKSGDGVMTYRYANFMYGGSSALITVIKAVVLNPMKAVYECVDAEKLKFIAWTMLPLLGMPLLTRRYERYILLIPYILINLMSDYPYQHDIFFQYTFGSTAFLLYLTVVNLADRKIRWRRTAAVAAIALLCAVCFGFTVFPRANQTVRQAVQYRDYYGNIREALDMVPEDAAVAATTFYTAHLSQREVLYDVRYCSQEHLLRAEYVVLQTGAEGEYTRYAGSGKEDGFQRLTDLLENSGYKLYHVLDGVLVIYRKT